MLAIKKYNYYFSHFQDKQAYVLLNFASGFGGPKTDKVPVGWHFTARNRLP